MEKLAYTLLAALILAIPSAAQNPQDLPTAPSAAQPRFPGAPAQPPQAQSPKPQATPVQDLPAPPAATPTASTAQIPATQTTPAKPKAAPTPMDPSSAFAPVTAAPPRVQHPNQVEPETGGDAEYRIGVDVDLVAMIFTAVDKKGHYIKDLKREDVRLLDEGKPPQRIEAFESETGGQVDGRGCFPHTTLLICYSDYFTHLMF